MKNKVVNKNNIVKVCSIEELMTIKRNFPSEDIKIELYLKYIDEELMELLKNISFPFSIIFENPSFKEKDLILLSGYSESSNNRVYLIYDISGKSLYEQSLLAYYIDRYHIPVLLKTENQESYQDWQRELTKYVLKKNVKRLYKTYKSGTK